MNVRMSSSSHRLHSKYLGLTIEAWEAKEAESASLVWHEIEIFFLLFSAVRPSQLLLCILVVQLYSYVQQLAVQLAAYSYLYSCVQLAAYSY